MSDRFDVVILGAGPAGEHAVNILAPAGLRCALVERELIGGECTNWGLHPDEDAPPPARGPACERPRGGRVEA